MPQWFFKAEDTVIKDQSNLHDTSRVSLSNLNDANLLDRIISKISILRVSPNVCPAQWFFKAKDTVIKDQSNLHDARCVFLLVIRDVNVLDRIISTISIVRVSPNVDLDTKERTIPRSDFQYNSSYSPDYSTSANLPIGRRRKAGLQTTNFTSRHNGFSEQKILLSNINLIFMIQDVFSYQISRMSTYLTVSSLRLLVYDFLQMYVQHNGFSKKKILLSKIHLIFMIQDSVLKSAPRLQAHQGSAIVPQVTQGPAI